MPPADPSGDRSALEYAPRGLIGVLTPQANTTVEPEFAILLPPGYTFINARLTSRQPSIEARLRDYWVETEAALDHFANAPLAAVAYGCTGASYLAGKDEEAALVARIESARGYPFVTAARAVVDSLRVLGAERIGLVSPYPAALAEASAAYWESHGFTVAQCVGAHNAGSAFHPIYSLSAASAGEALAELRGAPLDAVLMLGTGMPTLGPIAAAARQGGAPVLSCMLCLAWRTVTAVESEPPSAASLRRWVDGEEWSARLATLQPM